MMAESVVVMMKPMSLRMHPQDSLRVAVEVLLLEVAATHLDGTSPPPVVVEVAATYLDGMNHLLLVAGTEGLRDGNQ